MLLIPCGHTVCRQCAQSSCSQCGVNISSVTPNLMLQQIIMSHNQGNPRKTGTHASGSRCTGPKSHDNDYLPNKYEGELITPILLSTKLRANVDLKLGQCRRQWYTCTPQGRGVQVLNHGTASDIFTNSLMWALC